tara:strand:+ start:581 stop:838 length:258 start_codon:yes stop_codon:yes gene_type:complete
MRLKATRKYKPITKGHKITIDSLKRLNNVAYGYEITRLNGFSEHNGWKTFEYLNDLKDKGIVGKHKPNPKKAIWFLLPAAIKEEA